MNCVPNPGNATTVEKKMMMMMMDDDDDSWINRTESKNSTAFASDDPASQSQGSRRNSSLKWRQVLPGHSAHALVLICIREASPLKDSH